MHSNLRLGALIYGENVAYAFLLFSCFYVNVLVYSLILRCDS